MKRKKNPTIVVDKNVESAGIKESKVIKLNRQIPVLTNEEIYNKIMDLDANIRLLSLRYDTEYLGSYRDLNRRLSSRLAVIEDNLKPWYFKLWWKISSVWAESIHWIKLSIGR